MQALDAPLADDGRERAGVCLTNALTGWEPRTTNPLPFLVRFFRMAERRIAEKTGRGVVCFISNYSCGARPDAPDGDLTSSSATATTAIAPDPGRR